MRTYAIDSPPWEACPHEHDEGTRAPPRELIEPRSEDRLIRPLREAARTRDAREILVRACLAGARAGRATPLFDRALADLAATGAIAASSLRASRIRADELATLAAARLSGVRADDPALLERAVEALERARLVARYLDLDARGRAELTRAHPQLAEWIAVSGEDDAPARPVNSPPPRVGVERAIDVRVRDLALRARYLLADTPARDAPLVVLVHGHCSKVEEHDRLIAALSDVRAADGAPRYRVLSVDLAGWGYSTHLDHEMVAPPDAPGTPLLDFHEEFLEAFVDAVTAELDLPKRVACVAGGSLGGNIVLRLAERRPRWIERFAAWSPASVWGALTGDLIKGLGIRHTREHMSASETEHSRRGYFREVFATRICLTGRTQPEMWYRPRYPCRAHHIRGAIRDRREIYDAAYRRWHWRVAYEQLIFSHVTAVNGLAPWRRIAGPVLLAAGADDNFRWTHIFERTRDLAANLASIAVPGMCLLLADTGHSIHDERPQLLASAIDRFVRGT